MEELTVFLDQADDAIFFSTPTRVRIYDCVQGKAFATFFQPDRSLKTSAFQISSNAIHLGDPCYRGVAAVLSNLIASRKLWGAFKAAPLPEPRWSSIELVPQPLPAAAEEYVVLLQTMMDRVELVILKPANDSLLETCLRTWHPGSRPLSRAGAFEIELLSNPALATFSGKSPRTRERVAEAEWQGVGPFELSGFLASRIYSGGMYGGLGTDHQRARALADAFRQAVWADNYGTLTASQTTTPWSDWFCDLEDQTLVVCDASQRTITCLCCSDTDT